MNSAPAKTFDRLAISDLKNFMFGRAPHPVACGRGLVLGQGVVYPEINFTLPPLTISQASWPEVRRQYQEMITGICKRASELGVPGLVVEFETLPPMTVKPDWGLELTRLLADALNEAHQKHGLKSALRLTPNDTREHLRPPLMRRGEYWEGMSKFFREAAKAGADMIAIESTGGKEIHDEALMSADLKASVFALGVLGARDMRFLWREIVGACASTGIVASGDTACGFGNTAMVLAEQSMVPRVFAALVRVATVPRSLVAYEEGAVGPSKDCAYEGPYMKAIAGVPIAMEGKTAACAHTSPLGNIAQALCDTWSNESVPNVHLLSGYAPTVYVEELAYDCRLMNTAAASGEAGARQLRDWLVESDAGTDPQAWVLRPDVVLRISEKIIQEKDAYSRTRVAVLAGLEEIKKAVEAGKIILPKKELHWLDLLEAQTDELPKEEGELTKEIMESPSAAKFLPAEYGL
jgi:methanol--5-hydroxybenzimidazolylcobamide Co-methyltransferase